MSNIGALLKTLSVRKISGNTRVKALELIRGMTQEQKEERSGQMLTLLNNSKDEKEFIIKLEQMF